MLESIVGFRGSQAVGSGWGGEDCGAVIDGGNFAWSRSVSSKVEVVCVGSDLPCKVGFPVALMLFAPMQIRSPKPLVLVWLTMAVPKAPNGQGETRSDNA